MERAEAQPMKFRDLPEGEGRAGVCTERSGSADERPGPDRDHWDRNSRDYQNYRDRGEGPEPSRLRRGCSTASRARPGWAVRIAGMGSLG